MSRVLATSLGLLGWLAVAIAQDPAPTEAPIDVTALRAQAEQGDAVSQWRLGTLYEMAVAGAVQDFPEAAQWYRRAADQGYVPAQINLAGMYLDGRGVDQDDAQALRWLHLAADQNDSVAQAIFGGLYAEGRGVPQDEAEAVRWYRLAAIKVKSRRSTALPGYMRRAAEWLGITKRLSAGFGSRRIRDTRPRRRASV